MVRLSARMMALAEMVGHGARGDSDVASGFVADDAVPCDKSSRVLADVGTDHAFLPIYLCQNHTISSAIAMDVRKGPLSHAREHIDASGLADRIETRLSDGLEKLSVGEVDTILIAGMGGGLMQRILGDGETVARSVRELVLQPQSEIPDFRRFLDKNGYEFLDEDAVFEDGKYYFLMRVRPCSGKAYDMDEARVPAATRKSLSEAELTFGPILLATHHPVLYDYIEHEIRIWERNLERLRNQAETSKIRSRKNEVENKLTLLRDITKG